MKIVYSEKMAAKNNASFSPSALKPLLAFEHWQAKGLPMEVIEAKPLSEQELATAHDRKYVHAVLTGAINNGFGNKSADVAAALPYTSGAMYQAAQIAIAENTTVCAPVSGFHHAGWNSPCGFCTFNGLMITALLLISRGEAKRVAIIDCDEHYGNGTDAILSLCSEDMKARIFHYTLGERFGNKGDRPVEFFRELTQAMVKACSCDVILYQAGADCHIDDPLGGFLTTEQLCRRDEIVFAAAKKAGVPVAWNLAGGYQIDPVTKGIPAVLDIHTNTFKIAEAHCEERHL